MTETEQLYRWLRTASLLRPERACDPQIGDVVIEATRFTIDDTMLGTLDGIEETKDGNIEYLVTSWKGDEKQRWKNADARTVFPRTMTIEP